MGMPSEPPPEWDDLRARIIGLGERSLRKSHYPELEQRLAELERFRALLDQSNDLIFLVEIPTGGFADVNESACRQLGFSRQDLLAMSIRDLVSAATWEMIASLFAGPAQVEEGGKTILTTFHHHTGELPVEMSVRRVAFLDAVYAVIVARDITERQRADADLRESEERYRQLVTLSPDGIALYERGKIVFANPAMLRLYGAKSEQELIGKSVLELVHPTFRGIVEKSLAQYGHAEEANLFVEAKFLRLDGSTVDVELAGVPYNYRGSQCVQVIARDISEYKRHELEREAIISVGNALRKTTTRTEILTAILDQLVELFEAEGAMLALPNPITGEMNIEMGRGLIGERFTGLSSPPEHGISREILQNKQPYLSNRAVAEGLFYRSDLLADATCVAAVPLIAKEHAIGALWIVRRADLRQQDLRLFNAIGDIAANALHRVTLYEQTRIQLRHLVALHQIDVAITTNFDLQTTLQVILGNVKGELGMDAASVLLLTPLTQTLDYAAGVGFWTRTIEQSHVKLGLGPAGQAALEGHTVLCPDLRQPPASYERSRLAADEEFLSQFVAPLVAKGQVKGVLEVFQRKPFEPGQEWRDYFEILATQTAIALENASLFENLQRSNAELRLAYDATIEGWSRALDLRDEGTEGHTLRVTDMALQLADKMGMSESEKLNLRRGALLHDIGKMGVPDEILLKPGLLTEGEWEVMRKHPAYAYEMLKPIGYLRAALDIPYCHHEKWDGTGYPRGLKGNAIPLAARVFAVVDVFDALTVDRPYRQAWPKEKAYAYIREQAGQHFDPEVAAAFLEMEW